MPRCSSKTRSGERCKNPAPPGKKTCWVHSSKRTSLNRSSKRSSNRGSVYAPKKYTEGLSSSEKSIRIQEIRRGAKTSTDDPSAYDPKRFSTDFKKTKSGKLQRLPTKTSEYTRKFYEMYPGAKTLKQKSKATGIPLDIIERVYNKGLAAWRTGHRPGATQGQWGAARVHSFIMKGCTYYYPDHKLVEESKSRSKKSVEHWKNVKCICRKGCKHGKK